MKSCRIPTYVLNDINRYYRTEEYKDRCIIEVDTTGLIKGVYSNDIIEIIKTEDNEYTFTLSNKTMKFDTTIPLNALSRANRDNYYRYFKAVSQLPLHLKYDLSQHRFYIQDYFSNEKNARDLYLRPVEDVDDEGNLKLYLVLQLKDFTENTLFAIEIDEQGNIDVDRFILEFIKIADISVIYKLNKKGERAELRLYGADPVERHLKLKCIDTTRLDTEIEHASTHFIQFETDTELERTKAKFIFYLLYCCSKHESLLTYAFGHNRLSLHRVLVGKNPLNKLFFNNIEERKKDIQLFKDFIEFCAKQ